MSKYHSKTIDCPDCGWVITEDQKKCSACGFNIQDSDQQWQSIHKSKEIPVKEEEIVQHQTSEKELSQKINAG